MVLTPQRASVTPPATRRRLLTPFRSNYRPDVEGLRAIAVTMVVAYHANIPWVPGGFVGVDVFFVISGYLITRLLLRETGSTGTISLRQFYARRSRRIIPSATVALAVTGALGYVMLPPLRAINAAKDLILSSLFVSNWRFIAQGTNYLTQSQDPSPYLHYWSLAVEEQFYMVWPLLLLGCCWLHRRRDDVAIRPLIGTVLAAITLLSFALSLRWSAPQPPLAYMSTLSRAWQFGVGGLLAVGEPFLSRIAARTIAVAVGRFTGWLGLSALVLASTMINSRTVYPGLAALLPTLGTFGLILAGSLSGLGPGTVGSVLQLRPMRAVGRLSFTWYLWHWPALILFQARYGSTSWQGLSLVALASAVPAVLTMKLVEAPIRFSRLIPARPSSGFAIGSLTVVLALTVGLVTGTETVKRFSGVQVYATLPTLVDVFDGGRSAQNSGAVVPSPLHAIDDRPAPDSCILQRGEVTGPRCVFGASSGPIVALFGDSHAQQWQPALQDLAAKRGWQLVVITKAGCPAADIAPRADGANMSQPDCRKWRAASLQRIKALHASLIVTSSFGQYIPDPGELLTSWNRTLDELRTVGVPIAYIRDTPFPGKDIPNCISAHLNDWLRCAFPRSSALRTDPVEEQSLVGHEQHLNVLDFTNYLCPHPTCRAAESGTLFYRDDTHLTASLARIMEPALAARLDQGRLMVPAR